MFDDKSYNNQNGKIMKKRILKFVIDKYFTRHVSNNCNMDCKLNKEYYVVDY